MIVYQLTEEQRAKLLDDLALAKFKAMAEHGDPEGRARRDAIISAVHKSFHYRLCRALS